MAKTTFTRRQFYDLIWSESLAAISRKYNISYTSLRDVCQEMKIYLPENGYWSKLKFGKTVHVSEFRETTDGLQDISLWLRTDEEGEEYFSKDATQLKKNKFEIAKKIKSLELISLKTVPEDQLITKTKKYFDQSKKSDWKFTRPDKTLDILVSVDLRPRALMVMNKFIAMMKACGHAVIINNNLTYAIINNEELEISLREKSTRVTIVDKSWNHTELKPTGLLNFRYGKSYDVKEWVDNNILIEDRILDIISALELIALKEKNKRHEYEIYHAEQKRLELIKKNLQARKEKELLDFKNTFQLASRFQKAIELRNYINTFEDYSVKDNSLTDVVKNWIDWARKKADWYDPFIDTKDELLDEVDKNTLTFKNQNHW